MRKYKSIMSIVLAAMLVCVFAASNSFAISETEQIRQKIEQTRRQKEAAQKKANALAGKQKEVKQQMHEIDGDISEVQGNINLLANNITARNRAIAQNDSEIDNQNKKLSELDGKFKERVRSMYEQGPVAYLEVLLGSSDFTDFLSRLTLMNDILNHDKELMKQVSDAKNEIAAKRAQNEKEKSDLEDSKKLSFEQKSDLQQKLNNQTKLVSDLQKDKEKFLKMVEEAERIEDEQNQILRDLISREQSKSNRAYAGGKFAWPLSSGGQVTCGYGYRTDPKPGNHKGVDISDGRSGTPIVAANDGVVITAGYNSGGYGNYVIVDHGGGIATLYAHFSSIAVSIGDEVKRGQKLGGEGSTGWSTGNHLHFEVIVKGKNVNPMDYIR